MPASASTPPTAAPLRLNEVVAALSYALDLTEGQPMGHALRSCIIGMRLGQAIGLPPTALSDLYYALLLKDAGCSSNATRMFQIMQSDEIACKRDVKMTDWTKINWQSLSYALSHVGVGKPMWERLLAVSRLAASREDTQREVVQIRCERGADIARAIGFSEATAQAIRGLDEHWNGAGYPDQLRGPEIPLLARILNLAQTVEVYYHNLGRQAAIDVAKMRSKRWFDPDLVNAIVPLLESDRLAGELNHADEAVHLLEPHEQIQFAEEARVDHICHAFAQVIDAKSPYTFQHSTGVAAATIHIAQHLGLDPDTTTLLRRAALLHDIGKLSIPNSVLEKNGPLTDDEWLIVRRHPFYSQQIISRISAFEELAVIAGAHHERLNGQGYFLGRTADELPLTCRIVAVADVYDALSADRPYREGMPLERTFAILRKEAGPILDPIAVDAICQLDHKIPNFDPASIQPLTPVSVN